MDCQQRNRYAIHYLTDQETDACLYHYYGHYILPNALLIVLSSAHGQEYLPPFIVT